MGEWVKHRGPAAPWHLTEPQVDGGVSVACGSAVGPGGDADLVSWTDPDRHPPDSERCPACQGVFSGVMPLVEPARHAVSP